MFFCLHIGKIIPCFERRYRTITWFVFSLISLLGWGCADLFYKKGTDDSDKYSHLKIAVWVGLVMGVCAFALLPLSESGFSDSTGSFSLINLASNALKYSPASISYIVSMVVGYAGIRYLEMSIISPVQNASGALSTICMFFFFLLTGRISSFSEAFSVLDIIGTVIIVLGVIALAIVEKKTSKEDDSVGDDSVSSESGKRNYRFGALALIFPLIYCLFDTIGTAADGIILDEETGLGLGEIDVIIIYGLTFFLVGIACWIFLWAKTGKPYNPFSKSEKFKGIAAGCEEFGQLFYVYAMAARPMLAAPLIGSYCIVSIILSRIFLKERLSRTQYACVFAVVAGIILLGISEGLSS